MRVALVGKGGVGKTSISAMLVKILSEKYRVLAVDADPAGGLAMSLGVTVSKTLNDVRGEIIDMLRNRYDKIEIAASIDYKLFEALSEHDSFALLAVGRPEEEGCYCQLNSMLREAIEVLSDSFDVTVIDGEAGVEQINRRVMRSVDILLVVTDVSKKGLQVAAQIRGVAKGAVKCRTIGLVVNKARTELEVGEGYDFVHSIPEDATVFEFDLNGQSFLEMPECEALGSVRELVEKLTV
jgi:CO dehydrogenase maturation factor